MKKLQLILMLGCVTVLHGMNSEKIKEVYVQKALTEEELKALLEDRTGSCGAFSFTGDQTAIRKTIERLKRMQHRCGFVAEERGKTIFSVPRNKLEEEGTNPDSLSEVSEQFQSDLDKALSIAASRSVRDAIQDCYQKIRCWENQIEIDARNTWWYEQQIENFKIICAQLQAIKDTFSSSDSKVAFAYLSKIHAKDRLNFKGAQPACSVKK